MNIALFATLSYLTLDVVDTYEAEAEDNYEDTDCANCGAELSPLQEQLCNPCLDEDE